MKLILLLLIIVPLRSHALGSFASASLGLGGDRLSDSTGGQGYNIQAGSGISILGGVVIPTFNTEDFQTSFQLGTGLMIQSDFRESANQATWIRIPLESMFYIRKNTFRFGAGPIYHIGNQISAKGSYASAERHIENAFGWTSSAEVLMGWNEEFLMGIGIKYNSIKYKDSSFSKDADGSAFLLTLSGNWNGQFATEN